MLPTYKQANQYRKDALAKDDAITALKQDLATLKAKQTNGAGADADAVYWKEKYEGLLATVGG